MPLDLSPLWISLKTAAFATSITFLLGIAAAYWMLGYQGRWKSLIEGIFVSPLILPPTVVGFLLLLLFGKNGPIGQLMQPFNLTIVFTWYAAVITAIVVSFPLMYKTALGAFQQIDPSLLQVAKTLGASQWRIFWRILLPLAIPGILAGATLAFARALGEFGATLMLAGNIPGQTQTIPMAIYFAVEAGAREEAWFWVMVILSISTSGIVIVNVWQQSSNRRRGQPRTSMRMTRRSTKPAKPSHPGTSSVENGTAQSSETGLVVNIGKQLADFWLDVAFTTQLEAIGVLGASGAGKSMILRCIAGVETPTQGQIILNGKVLFDSARRVNFSSHERQVGLVFQNYALFPHMTVAENIAFGLHALSQAQRSQRVHQQITAMQLHGLGGRYPHQLSGGQQQRVAIARSLATEPEALLLDEPFSALDTYLRTQLEQQLVEILSTYRGVTLLVTHNLEEAYRICNKLLVMHNGQVIAQDSKQAIFERPSTYTVARLTGCKNFSQAIAISGNTVRAVDWKCDLHVLEPIPDCLAYVGIRAHHLTFVESQTWGEPQAWQAVTDQTRTSQNLFPCWLAAMSETPHRVTLYLKLHDVAEYSKDYHLQAEVYKEKWTMLKDRSFPWFVSLAPMRLMLMQQESTEPF